MSSKTTSTGLLPSSDMVVILPSGLRATLSQFMPRHLGVLGPNVRYRTKRHVALKVLTAKTFGDRNDTFELDILDRIKAQCIQHPGKSHILGLLDEFEHHGPNGCHVCLVFKAMGQDLSIYRRLFPGRRIPLPLLKQISRQLLLAQVFNFHPRHDQTESRGTP